jgi:NTE family protein
LPLPLSIVATDIGNGERVVFRDGPLSQAMRASMSVPGLLAPVDHQGRKLVDGGLVDNLPIAEVRERCQADVVIAVNVGTPLLKAEEVGSLLTVSAQMIAILTEQNVSRSLAQLQAATSISSRSWTASRPAIFPPCRSGGARPGGCRSGGRSPGRLAQPESYAAWWQGIEVTAVPRRASTKSRSSG